VNVGSGGSIYFDGKRFVIRGGWVEPPEGPSIRDKNQAARAAAFARQTWTAMVSPSCDDSQYESASIEGVLQVIDLRGCREPDALNSYLRRIDHWPSVIAAFVDEDAPGAMSFTGAIRYQVLVAQYVPNERPMPDHIWGSALAVEVASPAEFGTKVAGCTRPIVAVRRQSGYHSIEEVRAACDVLQRDLAPYGDFAGYLV